MGQRLCHLIYFFSLCLIFLNGCQESLVNLNPLSDVTENNNNNLKRPSVSDVNVDYDRLTLSGTNLDLVTGLQVTGDTNDHVLAFLSQSKQEIQAARTSGSGLTFKAGYTYSLIVSYSGGQTFIPLQFQLADNSISTTMLQNSSVTNAIIASSAVTGAKIETGRAEDGDVLMYSAALDQFVPAPEAATGYGGGAGVSGVTKSAGFIGSGGTISSTGTLALNIGNSANQVAAFDDSANWNLQGVVAIDYSINESGQLSLKDSVSSSDFRFFSDGKLKLNFTNDYVGNPDPSLYPSALEVEDDGDISTTQDLSVEENVTINANSASNSLALPTDQGSGGQSLVSNGIGASTWQTRSQTGTGTVTQVDTTLAGGLIGGPINTYGTIRVDVGTTVGKIVQVGASGRIASSLMPTTIDTLNIGTGLIDDATFAYLDNSVANIQNRFNLLPYTYQPLHTQLTTLSGLVPTADNFITPVAGTWTSVTPATTRTALGLGDMALIAQGGVTITGGNIDGTTIGVITRRPVTATSMVATTMNLASMTPASFVASGDFNVNGTIIADAADQDATIGVHTTYPSYAAFWKGGNAHYAVLANDTHVFLNANSGAGNIYFRANDTDLVTFNTTAMTLNQGSLSIADKLTVHGQEIINETDTWLRTYNDDGWYSQTYGGGWHMTDSTWLRAYSDKQIYTGGNEIRANKTLIGKHPNYPTAYSAFWRLDSDYSILVSDSSTYINAPLAAGNIYFRQSNTTAMTLQSDGDLVLSTTSAWAWKPGGGNWGATSDGRVKDIHGPYSRGLEAIRELNPVLYNYKKDNPKQLPSDKIFQGLVAQEVEPIISEAVSLGKDGYYELDSSPIKWAGINAIKQLDQAHKQQSTEQHNLHFEQQQQENRLAQVTQHLAELQRKNADLRADNQAIKSFLCQKHPMLEFCLTP